MAKARVGTADDGNEAAAVITKAQQAKPGTPAESPPAPSSNRLPAPLVPQAGANGSVATRQDAKPVAGPSDVAVHVEVICGGITKVKAPVAIGGLYQGLPLAGPAKAFDRQLDSWLTRALDLGMIGYGLGQIFPVPLGSCQEAGRVAADTLLIVGAGEPGHLTPDDVRFLIANVTVAVKAMGHKHFSSELTGSRRRELSIEQALKGFLKGVLDGYAHLRAMAEALTKTRDYLSHAVEEPLFISLVENDPQKAGQIFQALEKTRDEGDIPNLQLEISRGEDVPPEPEPTPNAVDTDPDEPMTLLRVSSVGPATRPTDKRRRNSRRVLQFSALADRSVVTVRDQELNAYFLRHLPARLMASASAQDQEEFGLFFTNYLVHDDFRPLLEAGAQLTLVVDATTASYPWEMAAFTKHSRTCFLGTDLRLARRFRTLLSPPPASPPPLNRTLNVLVVANPACGRLALPGAQMEGLAVLEAVQQAEQAWQGEYQFKVTARIGSSAEKDQEQKERLDRLLERLRQNNSVVQSADTCDPLELAKLIVNQCFDVIHYAGHGVFDMEGGQAGWVFDEDCVLSAQEIFRVRQVPRLVFANACHSAVTTDHEEQRRQLVGLAQAFFERGIQNYIGTGWEVSDTLAAECAQWFYRRALGLGRPNNGSPVIGRSPPAIFGQALADAREAIRRKGLDSAADQDAAKKRSTWGAYQHYGKASDKLLPLPNVGSMSA
jgi:hypothetical protein